ncbi:MAG: clan AA aspartic protease [Pseudomonadota bacterium]|nr:clan AA aspartic protease [Pseudomonadota bacterium]
MGLVRTSIQITNPRRSDLRPIEVDALVDTGALHLCIPQHIALQLDLEELEKREVPIAGSKQIVAYVGPIRTSFRNRSCYTGGMVLGDEVLLGTIPMDDMDLVVRPASRDIVPNPLNPNIPASVAMSAREQSGSR